MGQIYLFLLFCRSSVKQKLCSSIGTLRWAEVFEFLGQVKMRRKMKNSDKDNGPTSPTVPSITFDSAFDSGRELSSDVYSTVGTGTKKSFDKLLVLVALFICGKRMKWLFFGCHQLHRPHQNQVHGTEMCSLRAQVILEEKGKAWFELRLKDCSHRRGKRQRMVEHIAAIKHEAALMTANSQQDTAEHKLCTVSIQHCWITKQQHVLHSGL